ncbi:hypothetical protein [Bdellovibrio bacteriovorus]|nr:hypothetical protein [Bdellovibrio bacteriovorus]
MKKLILMSSLMTAALLLGSCGQQEEVNTEFSVTTSPLPLIPAKAISCYSKLITGIGQTPTQDVEADYFRIPTFKFWRANNSNDLVISLIRITYNLPGSTPGESAQASKCEISGDSLRALNTTWWKNYTEAIVPGGSGSPDSPFQTDCAAYCGGVKASGQFTTTGTVEIFGLERAPNGDETPVKLQGYVTIQAF